MRTLTTDYTFDDFSRLEQIRYPSISPSRLTVSYDFDDFGHVVGARKGSGPSDMLWRLVESDQGFRVKRERAGSHACGAEQGTLTERTYDPHSGALASISTGCGANAIQSLSYDYDVVGNMIGRHDALAGVDEAFRYDALGRITEIQEAPFAPFVTFASYDEAGMGRLTSRRGVGNYTYFDEGRDWVKTAGDASFVHDAVGNVSDRSGPGVPGGAQHIDYTAFDLPRQVVNGLGTTAATTGFGYDANGARVVKQGPSSTTFYAGESYQRIETTAGTSERFLISAGGRLIAQADGPATGSDPSPPLALRYLHDDALGSTQAVSSVAGGSLSSAQYDPFGSVVGEARLGSDLPYGFTGQESDDDIGLINMRGRMYDPAVGQFLSADPVVSTPWSQGLNRFAYVGNSPLNYVDPSGFKRQDVRSLIGAVESAGSSFMNNGGGVALAAGVPIGVIAAVSIMYGHAGPYAVGGAAAAGGGAAGPAGAAAGAGDAGAGAGILGLVNSPVGIGTAGLASVAYDIYLSSSERTATSTVRMTRSSVALSNGAPGRGAVAKNGYAPIQEMINNIAGGAEEEDDKLDELEDDEAERDYAGIEQPAPRVRINRTPRERLPGGDAVTTEDGNVLLLPRGAPTPRPGADPIGDRLADIAAETARDFNVSWLTRSQVRSLAWRNVFAPWTFNRFASMYAGQAIEEEFAIRASMDPLTRGVQWRSGPGPDFQQAQGSSTYYELTTVRQLNEHLVRPNMRPPGGTTRFLLYQGGFF